MDVDASDGFLVLSEDQSQARRPAVPSCLSRVEACGEKTLSNSKGTTQADRTHLLGSFFSRHESAARDFLPTGASTTWLRQVEDRD